MVGTGAASDSFTCAWEAFLPTGLSRPALYESLYIVLLKLVMHDWLISLEGLPFSERRQRRSGSGGEGR